MKITTGISILNNQKKLIFDVAPNISRLIARSARYARAGRKSKILIKDMLVK